MTFKTEWVLDFQSSEMQTNPWPTYQYFRNYDPIHWSERYKCYFVFKYMDVRTILLDSSFTVDHPFRATRSIFGPTVIDLEGERHKRIKSVIKPKFSTEQVNAYTADLIEPIVQQVINGIIDEPEVDLIEEFALQIPMKIILALVGFSQDDSAWFYRNFRPIIQQLDNPKSSSIVKAIESRDILVEKIRANVAKQTIADEQLIQNECPYSGHKYVNEDELVRHILLLLAAGTETTGATIGNLLHCLFTHPKYIEACKRSPDFIPKFIKETVRWQPPLHITLRFATEDVEINDVTIPKGSAVQLMLASANRDETYFEQPDDFNPFRREQHISFGIGNHACLGVSLANKELEVALRVLIDHIDKFPLQSSQVPLVEGITFRMPSSLKIKNDSV